MNDIQLETMMCVFMQQTHTNMISEVFRV